MNKVMVAGFFDPLQPGHLELFEFAKAVIPDAHVIVVIHNIEDIIKKSGFYVYDPWEIKELIKGFKHCVDEVVVAIDTDGSVSKTLEKLKPNYFIKGPDRNPNNMPENEVEICKKIGCEIVYQSGVKIGNSSVIKKRIKDQLLQPK
jgi:glycerol-3-phosphate cytidylyltransferase-like family protein